jgi:4a-hydroxytetrahydrobiopterin dehydratase
MNSLFKRCRPNAPALPPVEIDDRLPDVPQWRVVDGHLQRTFSFRNFHETMAFVNAVAWISHQQDHHPDLAVGYARCTVSYQTHSAGGALTENDFICAAQVDALLAGQAP